MPLSSVSPSTHSLAAPTPVEASKFVSYGNRGKQVTERRVSFPSQSQLFPCCSAHPSRLVQEKYHRSLRVPTGYCREAAGQHEARTPCRAPCFPCGKAVTSATFPRAYAAGTALQWGRDEEFLLNTLFCSP